MSEAFIGEMRIFAGNFAPLGWALCNGQLMSIAENTALFSILGTTYGGDGITTFALPDLRGRSPVSSGAAPRLTSYELGQVGGSETVSINVNQLPQHSHAVTVTLPFKASSRADTNTPTNNFLATWDGGSSFGTATDDRLNAGMAAPSVTVAVAGGSQPTSVIQPLLAVNYIICTEGIYPSRN